jgi:acetyltransferase-like isoleucine patch superfamily enzyme
LSASAATEDAVGTRAPDPHAAELRFAAGPVRKRRGRLARQFRKASLMAVGLIPLQAVKRLLFRLGFGYRIGRGVRIGVVYLDCERLTIQEGSSIAHGVVFTDCGEVQIGRHARIGALNLFRGGELIELGDYCLVQRLNVINAIPEHDCTNKPDSRFHLGYGSAITAEHRIDFTDRVSIGRCTTFGGRNSSIWTHNRRSGQAVEIGDYCYVGSEIRMAPGSRVPDCSIVGLGSVITKPIQEPFSLIAGVPARRIRPLRCEDAELLYGKTRPDLPDEQYPPIPPAREDAGELCAE